MFGWSYQTWGMAVLTGLAVIAVANRTGISPAAMNGG